MNTEMIMVKEHQREVELIRKSLTENVDPKKLKEAMIKVGKLRGSVKRKTTDEQYEWAREHILELLD